MREDPGLNATGPMAPFVPTEPLSGRITLLEASAGTGKTHSITWLFLRLITEPGPDGRPPLPANAVLVVTFTEAATAELRDRIRSALRDARTQLEQALACPEFQSDDPVVRHIAEQGRLAGDLPARLAGVRAALDAFDEVTISTIHGFCQRMLHHHAFESGAEFGATLAETGDLLDEVLLDFWATRAHDLPPERLAALRAWGLDALRAIAATAVAHPKLAFLPERRVEPPADPEPLRAQAVAFADRWRREAADAVDEILDHIAHGKLHKGRYKAPAVQEASEIVGRWVAEPAPDGVPIDALRLLGARKLADCVVQMGGKTKQKHAPPQRCAGFHEACDHLADAAQDFVDARNRELSAWLNDVKHDLVAAARREVADRKARRHTLSFDDLLHDLRNALAGPGGSALRQAIASQFQAAIIDEFQDTDSVQWDIFRTVFGPGHEGGRLFLIGDPKQAIYAFRQADIATYLTAGRAADVRRTLARNWRSDERLVRALNRLYDPVRLPDAFAATDIDYVTVDVPERHRTDRLRFPHEAAPSPPLRIAFLERGDRDKPLPKDVAAATVSAWVASDIADFLNRGPELFDRDADLWRPAHPGDLAVLVRTHRQGAAVQRALRRLGIPSIRKGQDQILRSSEADELIDLLAAILQPADRRAVRTALATRFLGLAADGLARLEAEDSRLDAWVGTFAAWADTWRTHGFMRMFREAASQAAVVPRMLGWDDGERRVTNYLHLAEILHREAARLALRPEGLLAWLVRQRANADKTADADENRELVLRLESDAHAVQITTIHGSKGLQYPVIWCPFLWDARLPGNRESLVLFHGPDGLAADMDPEGEAWESHHADAVAEAYAENLRLAYVALTRARHACTVVTGGINGLGATPLGRLFHPTTPAERTDTLSDEARLADIQELADASEGTMGWVRIAPSGSGRWQAPAQVRAELETRQWGRRMLDPLWRKASFTNLVKSDAPHDPDDEDDESRNPEGAEAPDDAGLAGPAPAVAALGTSPLAEFPRGDQAGNCLHDIFERIDFAPPDPTDWDPILAERLRARGFADDLQGGLRDALSRIVATPLGDIGGAPSGGPRLRDIQPQDRWDEMEFHLPVSGGLDARPGDGRVARSDLVRILRETADPQVGARYADHVERIRMTAFRGFLTGKIDLVFRVRTGPGPADATWHVVDYKSNFLGTDFRDYAADRLAVPMHRAHYHLQAHLYLVALHRILALRLGDAYRPDHHLGGAYYLFVRGMRGHQDGGDTGVFRYRPPTTRIERLDQLFRQAQPLPGGEE